MINEITILGYKSIKNSQPLALNKINILIGSNGAGKSNFLSVFKFVKSIVNKNLQKYVIQHGGANNILHFGSKNTKFVTLEIKFGSDRYSVELTSARDTLMIENDVLYYVYPNGYEYDIPATNNQLESNIRSEVLFNPDKIADKMLKKIDDWKIYHFHDTSETSPIKNLNSIDSVDKFHLDGGNLSAYLYFLKNTYPKSYIRIEETIKLVASYFDKFQLEPEFTNEKMIKLKWYSGGHDYQMSVDDFSDGTLRFICYATLLLQPEKLMPDTIIIDEPELGLHPKALAVLAAMIKGIPDSKQIIVSTQSVELINHFEIEDLIVVDRYKKESSFKRLERKDFESWLEDYSLGDLWNKNLLGGR